MAPSFDALSTPLPPFSLKAIGYCLARLGLGTIGRLSTGISIGHRHGFDSGVMLDYVYENEARGRTFLGRWIDRLYLDAPGWTGIRHRGALLQATIEAELRRAAAEGREAILADLACGGGRYVLGALARARGEVRTCAVLRDYVEANVARATANAHAAGLDVTIETADAFSDADLERLEGANLVVVSGLHEIIADDRLVERHFHQIARVLPAGGRLVLTIQPDHPQVEFIARVLTSHDGRPWVMRLRPIGVTRAWLVAAGFAVESLVMEPTGLFGVIVARKR